MCQLDNWIVGLVGWNFRLNQYELPKTNYKNETSG
jgi:hypothetical protein